MNNAPLEMTIDLGADYSIASTRVSSYSTLMDITNVRVLYLKGILFLLIGVLSGVVIILDHPTLKMAGLLAVCVWAFARAYYFAFYVIEHYVDRSYRFAGLGSFLRYALKRGPKGDK